MMNLFENLQNMNEDIENKKYCVVVRGAWGASTRSEVVGNKFDNIEEARTIFNNFTLEDALNIDGYQFAYEVDLGECLSEDESGYYSIETKKLADENEQRERAKNATYPEGIEKGVI